MTKSDLKTLARSKYYTRTYNQRSSAPANSSPCRNTLYNMLQTNNIYKHWPNKIRTHQGRNDGSCNLFAFFITVVTYPFILYNSRPSNKPSTYRIGRTQIIQSTSELSIPFGKKLSITIIYVGLFP